MARYIHKSPEQQCEDWIRENPSPPDEEGAYPINSWTFDAANACWWRNLTEAQAFNLISQYVTITRNRPYNAKEIQRAIRKAYSSDYSFNITPPLRIPPFSIDLLSRFAANVEFDVTDDWLAKASPECVTEGIQPAEFLQALYQPGESVVILDDLRAKASTIWRHGDSLKNFQNGKQGVWFMNQPMTGTCIDGSYRSEANVTSWRYGILETDDAPDDLWRKLLIQLPLPIVAIYHSGKRGCHALIRYDAESKEHFDLMARDLKRQLVPYGACDGSFKAVNATRLPGCIRGETGKLQKLLYLAPDAEQKPILTK